MTHFQKLRPPPICFKFHSELVYSQNLDICRFPLCTLIRSYNARVQTKMCWFNSFLKNSFIWQYIHPPYPYRIPVSPSTMTESCCWCTLCNCIRSKQSDWARRCSIARSRALRPIPRRQRSVQSAVSSIAAVPPSPQNGSGALQKYAEYHQRTLQHLVFRWITAESVGSGAMAQFPRFRRESDRSPRRQRGEYKDSFLSRSGAHHHFGLLLSFDVRHWLDVDALFDGQIPSVGPHLWKYHPFPGAVRFVQISDLDFWRRLWASDLEDALKQKTKTRYRTLSCCV